MSDGDGNISQDTSKYPCRTGIEWKVGAFLDAEDKWGKWAMAKILEIKDNLIFIHYYKWSAKFDEWIDMESERLRPHKKSTNKSTSRSDPVYNIGDIVLARWRDTLWYQASVIGVDTKGNYELQFTLDGWKNGGYRASQLKPYVPAEAEAIFKAQWPVDESNDIQYDPKILSFQERSRQRRLQLRAKMDGVSLDTTYHGTTSSDIATLNSSFSSTVSTSRRPKRPRQSLADKLSHSVNASMSSTPLRLSSSPFTEASDTEKSELGRQHIIAVCKVETEAIKPEVSEPVSSEVVDHDHIPVNSQQKDVIESSKQTESLSESSHKTETEVHVVKPEIDEPVSSVNLEVVGQVTTSQQKDVIASNVDDSQSSKQAMVFESLPKTDVCVVNAVVSESKQGQDTTINLTTSFIEEKQQLLTPLKPIKLKLNRTATDTNEFTSSVVSVTSETQEDACSLSLSFEECSEGHPSTLEDLKPPEKVDLERRNTSVDTEPAEHTSQPSIEEIDQPTAPQSVIAKVKSTGALTVRISLSQQSQSSTAVDSPQPSSVVAKQESQVFLSQPKQKKQNKRVFSSIAQSECNKLTGEPNPKNMKLEQHNTDNADSKMIPPLPIAKMESKTERQSQEATKIKKEPTVKKLVQAEPKIRVTTPKSGAKKSKATNEVQFPAHWTAAETFDCSECGKSFRKQNLLDAHMRFYHNNEESMDVDDTSSKRLVIDLTTGHPQRNDSFPKSEATEGETESIVTASNVDNNVEDEEYVPEEIEEDDGEEYVEDDMESWESSSDFLQKDWRVLQCSCHTGFRSHLSTEAEVASAANSLLTCNVCQAQQHKECVQLTDEDADYYVCQFCRNSKNMYRTKRRSWLHKWTRKPITTQSSAQMDVVRQVADHLSAIIQVQKLVKEMQLRLLQLAPEYADWDVAKLQQSLEDNKANHGVDCPSTATTSSNSNVEQQSVLSRLLHNQSAVIHALNSMSLTSTSLLRSQNIDTQDHVNLQGHLIARLKALRNHENRLRRMVQLYK